MNLKALVDQQHKDYSTVIQQIELFKQGVNELKLLKPATLGEGIHALNRIEKYATLFEQKTAQLCKFTPASGAATRMFKEQYNFAENNNIQAFESSNLYLNLNKLALATQLESVESKSLLHELLSKFGSKPKGLIPFHTYNNSFRTAFEEHFIEATQFLAADDELHFTIHPNYQKEFEAAWQQLHASIQFKCSFSIQHPSTDTIAVDHNNEPVLDSTGKLVFRPGGHGALIHNLNEINSAFLLVKNIDNVCHQQYLDATISTKKQIGGYLLFLTESVHRYCKQLEQQPTQELVDKVIDFIQQEFFVELPKTITSNELLAFLNRPIRVAGMVKNTGEPGGGPYWVEKNNKPTLQIVEMAQINSSDEKQMELVQKATHFNPVDLALSVYNYKGEKFNLTQYVDANEVFIAQKTINGTPIKALELPGLWNGAMSNWLTTFVEVPLETFNPVKSVNDLLRPAHQEA